MKTASAVCAGLLVAAAAGVNAQQDKSPPVPAETLTLTGCMDRARNGTYQLLNAHRGPAGSVTPKNNGSTSRNPTATGTSGATRTQTQPAVWVLKSTADLAPHVGHQVEITGRASAGTGTGETDTATTSPPTTTATGARMKELGEIANSVDVQTVRMVSRSCP
jgi:hypothetical protein